LGIDLDVAEYKEHSIGGTRDANGAGFDVKAATYIECVSPATKEKVWGVGIHQDVVQASLIALLSAASSVSFHFQPCPQLANHMTRLQFLSSPNTPLPHHLKSGTLLTAEDVKTNGTAENGAAVSGG
jgi:hypothetical protein